MPEFNNEWTLFLDRDGVINVGPGDDYVRNPEQFFFLPEVPEAISILSKIFGRIIVVTNQQGCGKGYYSEETLDLIHQKLINGVINSGGRIDKIYFCAALASENSLLRKPEVGMALEAKKEFPEIDFKKSVMVGDAITDMQFGEKLGMYLVFMKNKNNEIPESPKADEIVYSLKEWAEILLQK